MGKRNKFENVDVMASLEAIMKQNTGFYQSDFDIDKQIIAEKAASPSREDKTLLWLSRPSGTYCFRERDVFIKDTAPNNTWRFYKEQTRDPILAYAVELTGVQDGKIKGNLYELDYEKHYERVKDNTVDAGTVTLVYEQGTREQPADRHFDGYPDPQLGKFERFEIQPKDPEALQFLLQEEKRSRDKLTPGDFPAHIEALHGNLIEREARRIVADMKKLPEPNSPDKSHFMVELSPVFTRLASTKDTERLFSMLPYKTLSFSELKDQRGTYALIGKDENRDKGIRKPRPSVRAQLAQEKKRTAPQKGGDKEKRSRIGGMSMNRFNSDFTVEETNLLSIYMTGSREGLLVAMNAALPFMEGEMRDFAARTLEKVAHMTEAEFAGLAVYPADEV